MLVNALLRLQYTHTDHICQGPCSDWITGFVQIHFPKVQACYCSGRCSAKAETEEEAEAMGGRRRHDERRTWTRVERMV